MKCDKVVLATTNAGKIAEFSGLLAGLGVEVAGLNDFPDLGEIAETGETFAENALIKARAVAKATGLVAIADDSGLMVDALAGAPGVRSARFSEDLDARPGESRDQRNIRKLLQVMRKVPGEQRGCHFVTVMAACAPDGEEITATGKWFGNVLEAPLGKNGFGYDPVFWDPQLGKTAAQLKKEEKNAVSHRSKAVAALIAMWPDFAAKLEQSGSPEK